MNEKIIQIIPAPPGMKAQFEEENRKPCCSNGRINAVGVDVACLALVELPGGGREVRAYSADNAGCFYDVSQSDGFLMVTM